MTRRGSLASVGGSAAGAARPPLSKCKNESVVVGKVENKYLQRFVGNMDGRPKQR